MRLRRQPQVIHDLVEIADFIAEGSLESSDSFLLAIEDTFQTILGMPRIGRLAKLKNPALQNIRMWRVKGFENYLIFYRVAEAAVIILRVIHGARDIETLFED